MTRGLRRQDHSRAPPPPRRTERVYGTSARAPHPWPAFEPFNSARTDGSEWKPCYNVAGCERLRGGLRGANPRVGGGQIVWQCPTPAGPVPRASLRLLLKDGRGFCLPVLTVVDFSAVVAATNAVAAPFGSGDNSPTPASAALPFGEVIRGSAGSRTGNTFASVLSVPCLCIIRLCSA